jgi:hypothetical protein
VADEQENNCSDAPATLLIAHLRAHLVIEEMPTRLAHQHFDELLAAERARTQEDFWRTRTPANGDTK